MSAMSTQVRPPLATLPNNDVDDGNMTVEQFLTRQCDFIIADLRKHGDELISNLHKEYVDGAAQVRSLMATTASGSMTACVTLKCIAGAHLGQKFRLEAATPNGEDTFKMGRSTGRLFREKGVSLYKDKEISTTHAKIAMRNGQIFLVDAASTNGTQLNGGDDLAAHAPMLLKNGDVITMGSTELLVAISDAVDDVADENTFS